MDKPSNIKFSTHLILTAGLSGGLTIGTSLIYILLCIFALILRLNCDTWSLDTATGDEYYWKTVFSAYILNSDCAASKVALQSLSSDITGEYTVFVLTAIILSVSILCLVAAIALVTVIAVQDERAARYINLVVSVYIGSCIASLVVDLTTATHFGLDYTALSSELKAWIAGSALNYKTEVLRQGALTLMSIALKGYVCLAINIVLIILLIIYVVEHRTLLKNHEHSIHKLGALNAYDQPRKPNDNWSSPPEPVSPFTRGPQFNNGFVNNEDSPPRSPRREPTRSDYNYSNRSFDRSDSWHHTHANAAQNARPFTYLEDMKRPAPARLSPSPAVDTPWRRDPWPPAPSVPAPDYSPLSARRLKSALKPTYM